MDSKIGNEWGAPVRMHHLTSEGEPALGRQKITEGRSGDGRSAFLRAIPKGADRLVNRSEPGRGNCGEMDGNEGEVRQIGLIDLPGEDRGNGADVIRRVGVAVQMVMQPGTSRHRDGQEMAENQKQRACLPG